MGLASEMKNLSEELLSSFKQRIKENEQLVNDVQKTLDGFRKDHMEMASILNANAINLRKELASGEKNRLKNYNGLMSGILQNIASIQKEVMDIQKSTFNMLNEFAGDRTQMAADLNKFFAEGRAGRMEDEKTRMMEFDDMMKIINDDINSINAEVAAIFKSTNDMLVNFENEHAEMSAELRAELGKNLAERVEYTRSLLHGFQVRLSEISKENQKTAQKLRKDLASGEATRLGNYKGLMKDIHDSIKGIQKEVRDIQKASAGMVGGYAKERTQGAAEWNKMQEAIAQLRKTGIVKPSKAAAVKPEKKKEIAIEVQAEDVKEVAVKEVAVKDEPEMIAMTVETPVEATKEIPIEIIPEVKLKEPVMMTLEEKILDYINKHPMGVKISEMEAPLGDTRMKIGFIAKKLLEEGKIQKMDNIFFPSK
jgi:hypothetical protein